MRRLITNQHITRQQRDRRLLLLCVLLAVLFGLIGVNVVARLVLSLVTPYGQVYPQSLLAQLSANYQPWEVPAIPLPALNPAAAIAAEQDIIRTDVPEQIPVPAAVLPTDPPSSSPTSTALPPGTPTRRPAVVAIAPTATATATALPSPVLPTPAPTPEPIRPTPAQPLPRPTAPPHSSPANPSSTTGPAMSPTTELPTDTP